MPDKPLNILLITSDQQHWDTIGTRNPRIRTPALDRLAREGSMFTRAYTTNPVCSPSRSSIITGMYPSLHHCWTIGVKLPEDVPVVGDLFGDNGYATALIGKAHFQPLASRPGVESIECQPTLRDLEFWRHFHGPWYGFEYVETARNHADESHAGQHYALWMEEKGFKNWREYFRDWPEDDNPKREISWNLPQEYHYTNWITERSIEKIHEYAADDRPFFLWASYMDPHPPYLVSEPWASMYRPEDMRPGTLLEGELERMPPQYALTQQKNPDFSDWWESGHGNHGFHSHVVDRKRLKKLMAVYYGMVSFMDDGIGRILDSIDELGIAENTLVVFTTDHGHYLGQHGLSAKGAFHYDDLLRIPFLARCPGSVPPDREVESLLSLADLAPTFLDACGMEVPGVMQGISQWPAWTGKTEKVRDHVIVENRHQPTKIHVRVYIDERYKIAVYRGADYGEMFDLVEDPGEKRNLWDEPEYAEIKARLLLKFVQAEIMREPTRMPRIAGA